MTEMRTIKPKQYDSALGSPMGKKAKKEKVYPTIRIDHDHLPETKDWEVGKKYHLHMHVKMVGNSQSRYQNEGEYEIHKIGADDGEEHEEGEAAKEDSAEDKSDLESNHDDTEK